MDSSTVTQEFFDIVRRFADHNRGEIDFAHTFEYNGIDSTSFLKLITEISSQYGVEIKLKRIDEYYKLPLWEFILCMNLLIRDPLKEPMA